MKRKAIALAVGALFTAPAAHAQITFGNESIGTVQLYGKLYPQFGVARANGATAPGTTGVSTLVGGTAETLVNTIGSGNSGSDTRQRNAVDVQNSYIGFRGQRALGSPELKAIWQIETTVNFDDPGASGSTTGRWATRDSFVGLSSSKLGTVRLGQMDTVYKRYGDQFSMFGISSGNFVSASNVLSQIGVGNSTTARFNERRTNSIDYETPTFANITAGVMYGPDEAKGDVGNVLNKSLWSYGVKWDTEHFYASLAHEIHNDFFGGSNNIPNIAGAGQAGALRNTTDPNAHSTDSATRGSGEIRFLGTQRITLDVARLNYRERGQTSPTATKFESYIKTTWAIGWDAGWGAWRTAIQYIRSGTGTCSLVGTAPAGCSTTGLQGSMLNLGVRYRFDRQTFVYVIAGRLNNGPSARFDNWANSDPERGADIKQAAVGISYSF